MRPMNKRVRAKTASMNRTVKVRLETDTKLDELKRLTKISKQDILDMGVAALIERLAKTGVLS